MCYIDVTRNESLLYAVTYGTKVKAKAHVFDESITTEEGTTWDVMNVLTLPCDGYISIHVR